MAVTYSTSAKNSRLTTTADVLKSQTPAAATGSALAPLLVIGTAGLSGATGVLVSISLPTGGLSVATGVLTLISSSVSATATGTGTAALAEIRQNAGTVVVSGLTVGTSGTDVVLGAVAVSSGQTVTVTTATITHA